MCSKYQNVIVRTITHQGGLGTQAEKTPPHRDNQSPFKGPAFQFSEILNTRGPDDRVKDLARPPGSAPDYMLVEYHLSRCFSQLHKVQIQSYMPLG